jgi:hypothetical protein
MRTKLAIATILAALACAAPATAAVKPKPPSYPQCNTRTYEGAVCAVRANIAAYGPAYGSPSQRVQCYWAGKRRIYVGWPARPKVQVLPRWSCHTEKGNRAIVIQRTGQVMWLLVLTTREQP